MTTKELSNEFDIHYDSITSKQAPGLDLYEKSVFLSKAQLEIVKSHFGIGNKYKKGFEADTKRRVDLSQLISTSITKPLSTSPKGLHPNSIFFSLKDDVLFIIYESAQLISIDSCLDKEYVKVVPKTHDEYSIQIKNPFKRPDNSVIWRLDHGNLNVGIKNVELITSEKGISEYKVRYIKYPEPIILTNLSTDYPNEGLSIDSKTTEQTSLLDKSIHSEILDRAIEIASMSYKMNEVQTRTQFNLRNE